MGGADSLSVKVEAQFRDWDLTEAENDVAGLILRGVSLKEIALACVTSQAAIRQQARSVCRKAGLTGRAELSACFLEDLFEVRERALEDAEPPPDIPPQRATGPAAPPCRRPRRGLEGRAGGVTAPRPARRTATGAAFRPDGAGEGLT